MQYVYIIGHRSVCPLDVLAANLMFMSKTEWRHSPPEWGSLHQYLKHETKPKKSLARTNTPAHFSAGSVTKKIKFDAINTRVSKLSSKMSSPDSWVFRTPFQILVVTEGSARHEALISVF